MCIGPQPGRDSEKEGRKEREGESDGQLADPVPGQLDC